MGAVLTLALSGLVGLLSGSFVNRWAWRLSHGESLLGGRSHCASCGHDLSPRDLVPVISWALSRRRCRYCKEKVPIRYPLSEVACASVFVAVTAVYGVTFETVQLLAFSCILLFASLTDIDERIIPNGCIIAAIALRVAYLALCVAGGSMASDDVMFYVWSAFGLALALLAIAFVAERVFKRESMGGGDIKLYFVAGLYFGWQQGLLLVMISCLLGIMTALASSRAAGEKHPKLGHAIPLGPSIAAACVITMLGGNTLVSWYVGAL